VTDTRDRKGDTMDVLVRLMAISLVTGKRQKDQVRLLSLAGMGPKEIAELIGTTPNTVNVALSQIRKEKKMNLKTDGEKDGE
jgi:DNA-directed RNA polymerase specialized sigma24 family protein